MLLIVYLSNNNVLTIPKTEAVPRNGTFCLYDIVKVFILQKTRVSGYCNPHYLRRAFLKFYYFDNAFL